MLHFASTVLLGKEIELISLSCRPYAFPALFTKLSSFDFFSDCNILHFLLIAHACIQLI